MAKQIQIKIPKPCHENWDAMTEAQKGKFCGVCSKTVLDFSLMGDGQIIDTLKSTIGTICGRFSNDQLERPLVKPLQPKWYIHGIWKYVLSSFLLFKVANIKAQKNVDITRSAFPDTGKKTKLMGKIIPPVDKKMLYKGKVTFDTGEPVYRATIEIIGTSIQRKTDSKGNFTLYANQNQSLRISLFGFEEKIIQLDKNNVLNIVMESAHIITVGIIDCERPEILPIPELESIFTIKDSVTGNPIPFAKAALLFNNKKIFANADENGTLIIKTEKEEKPMGFIIAPVGYKAITISQLDWNGKEQEIKLAPVVVIEDTVVITGFPVRRIKKELSIGNIIIVDEFIKSKKEKVTQPEENKVANVKINPVSINIFPNPVATGETIMVELEVEEPEIMMFRVSTTEGKIVLMQKENLRKGNHIYSIKLPQNISAQILVVQLMNSRGKWIVSEKLRVQ